MMIIVNTYIIIAYLLMRNRMEKLISFIFIDHAGFYFPTLSYF